MAVIKVDKGIKMPKRHANSGNRKSQYPWETMKVGESFQFNGSGPSSGGYSMVRHWTKRLKPKVFEARAHDGGLRCWRTK